MKIISWNVNGLRSALSKNFSEFVAAAKPDILCLQETRIGSEAAEKLDLPFTHRYFYCAERAGYSGTAILSNIEPQGVRRVSLCGGADEGRVLVADFGGFSLASIYAPNAQAELKRIDYKHAWNAGFADFAKSNAPLVACGDFNVAHNEIDIARPKENEGNAGFSETERADFSEILSRADMSDIWRERNPDTVKYSWWSYRGGARRRNIGWRLDYFLLSRSLLKNVSEADILDGITGSDHAPISLEIFE